MVSIEFSDLRAQHREIDGEITQAIKNVINRSDFILGKEVGLFEREFARFCHSRYAVGISSGTEALFLSALSLGIGRNDEVIVPVFTYIATALAVSYTGARPVFVDIEKDTYNIDVVKTEKAITKHTKAIIPVHLYGQPANMPEILRLAKANHLRVIEDAAQAHGAAIIMQDGKWHITGSLGDIGCFSFYPSKNLGGMGDGGMVVTDNEELYKKLLILRDSGRISKYEHIIIGYNARLDTIQAAILRVKLRRLNLWNKMRSHVAAIYNNLLKDIEGIIIPHSPNSVRHIYHVYAIRTKRRDELFRRLKEKGIGVIVHYPLPLHLAGAYKDLGYKRGDFPIAEEVAGEIISLPMYPQLKETQLRYIARLIKDILRGL